MELQERRVRIWLVLGRCWVLSPFTAFSFHTFSSLPSLPFPLPSLCWLPFLPFPFFRFPCPCLLVSPFPSLASFLPFPSLPSFPSLLFLLLSVSSFCCLFVKNMVGLNVFRSKKFRVFPSPSLTDQSGSTFLPRSIFPQQAPATYPAIPLLNLGRDRKVCHFLLLVEGNIFRSAPSAWDRLSIWEGKKVSAGRSTTNTNFFHI